MTPHPHQSPQRRRRHTEKGRARRAELLAIYLDLLVKEGLAGASLNKIGQVAGVPVSTVLYYFRSKALMTAELVDELINKYEASHGRRALYKTRNPRARLNRLLDLYFTAVFQKGFDNRAYSSCFTLSLYDADIRSRFEAMFERSERLIEDVIRDCIDDGYIRRLDAEKAAVAIYALSEGHYNLTSWNPFGAAAEDLGRLLRNQALQVLGLQEDAGDAAAD